ncbi:MAG TPA: CBS domain-containing protein, partial [Noviherbaspirillum sp.]|nr:CBS domain-containing protein [Noviherbaspirillum sp.]
MEREELIVYIQSLLEAQDAQTIRALMNRVSMADLAEALSNVPVEDAVRFWNMLDQEERLELFVYFPHGIQDAILAQLPRPALVALFDQLPSDDRADIYKRMDDEMREKLMPALAKVERDDILKLAAYEEGTVGSITTSDYATVQEDMTVAEALRVIRAGAPDKETIYVVYVLDELRRLVGTVSLRELVLEPESTRLGDLMHREPIYAEADAPREEAARLISRYDLLAVPVVDAGRRMIGIVTVDDAMAVAQEETTEDFHKSGGMAAPEGMSVRSASVFQLYR